MKITVEREPLLSALRFIQKHVNAKDAIPILTHAKIDAGDGRLAIIGTNIERAAQTSLAVECSGAGSFCLPAEMLTKAVKASAGAEVSIAVDGTRATVAIGKSRFTFDTLPAVDFPDMPMLRADAEANFTLPAAELLSLDKKVGFCPSTDINRQYLSGTYWHVAESRMAFCCLDGVTMSLLERETVPAGVHHLSAIVPLLELPAWTGEVSVSVSSGFIRFSSGNDVVASKLIEGSFIDYRRIFNALDNRTLIRFDRKEMQDAIARIMVNIDAASHSILFSGKDGKCLVSTRTAKGDAEDEVAFDGEDFVVAITSRVIRPILASIESEIVEMRYADTSTPVLFVPASEPGRTLFAYPYRDPRITGLLATGESEAA